MTFYLTFFFGSIVLYGFAALVVFNYLRYRYRGDHTILFIILLVASLAIYTFESYAFITLRVTNSAVTEELVTF